MFKTYDSTQAAFVERDKVKYYDSVQAAWLDVKSAKTYDAEQAAWVERMKKYMEVSVTDGFYKNTGNVVYCYGEIYHNQVKPTSEGIYITASIKGDFVNPIFACTYTFGYSDLCPNIAGDFRSHACVTWQLTGWLNGEQVGGTNIIAHGSNYAYATIFNEPKTIKLTGTYDEIRVTCYVMSYSNYTDFGKANTALKNITIDGKPYYGKQNIYS